MQKAVVGRSGLGLGVVGFGLAVLALAGCGGGSGRSGRDAGGGGGDDAPPMLGPKNCLNGTLSCPPEQECSPEGQCVPRADGGGTGPGDATFHVIDGAVVGPDGAPAPDATPSVFCATPGESRACGSNMGVCQSGMQLCTGVLSEGTRPMFGPCVGEVGPSEEICDGLDNDCDGIVDNRDPPCDCVDGTTRDCGESNQGRCRFGSQACVDGHWGPCVGNIDPLPFRCDENDNDCSGMPDYLEPPCECRNTEVRTCGSNRGVCTEGTQTCLDGRWSSCTGTPPRTTNPNEAEAGLCNGEDDNCDGNVDEGCECSSGQTRECGSNVGVCRSGTQTCRSNGTWGDCMGATGPRTTNPNEADAGLCNGQDDNCDGNIDEGCACSVGQTRGCGSDVGYCRPGTQTCQANGTWGDCLGGRGPRTTNPDEAAAGLCNGEDDNCDGNTDEGCECSPPATRPCGTDTGDCIAGVQQCQPNGTFGACSATGPTARQCDDHDRDCDGTPDYMQPPCQCRNGDTRACGSDVGECRPGTQTCVNGQYGACNDTGPRPETCDGKDNDCDGTPDNGLRPPTAVACWVAGNGQTICQDPSNVNVPPLATVQLDGRQSSDPDGQTLSYAWRIASAPSGSTINITNPTSSRPTLFAQLAGDYRLCLAVTDTTGCRSSEACVTVHVVPSSRIHIQLVWDKDETDVDLHFMLDSINNFYDDGSAGIGANCGRAKDCFWICKVPGWGAAGTADDPRLDIDDVNGFGPENINEDAPFNSNYAIAVHYYCDRPGPNYTGSHRGATTATVRLFVDGVQVRQWQKSLTVGQRWHVADMSWTNGNSPPYVLTDRDQVTASINDCIP